MHEPKYCLFFDNHTMPACPDVGSNFDVELFTDRVKKCGVDYLTFHARCNMGMAYYDTKIGTMHPSLKYDLFGKLSEACKRKDIALTAYLNAGISHAEGIQHRDWLRINFDGQEYGSKRDGAFVRIMCFNTSYRDHVIAMIVEIAGKYPVAGFFVDCMGAYDCICPVCVKEMKSKGIDWTNKEEVVKFAAFSAARIAGDIALAVRKVKPDLLLYFNGVNLESQKESCTYMECECLPTGGWGYDYLPVQSRYMRTLGEKTILNMTGRFHKSWGDFGGIRTKAGMEYDLYYGLAHGMRPNVGSHFHPRGDINHAVFDLVENIYREIRQNEPWHTGAVPQADIAIVANSNSQPFCTDPALMGATRMLEELKYQFDVVSNTACWDKYKVLILPDNIVLDKEYAGRLKKHLEAGKTIVSSAFSGLDPIKGRFVLEKYWGVKYLGANNFEPAYFSVYEKYASGLPEMPLCFYETGTEMEALDQKAIGAELIAPYYNVHWDGEYPFRYTPPDKLSGKPALTVTKQVAHFSHPIFAIYYNHAPLPIKKLLDNVLKKLFPEPMIKSENLPSFAKVMVTAQPNRKIVHLLSYLPERRGKSIQMIEEPIELHNMRIAVRIDEKAPGKVYLAPGRTPLSFETVKGYAWINIPVIKGHALVVLEK